MICFITFTCYNISRITKLFILLTLSLNLLLFVASLYVLYKNDINIFNKDKLNFTWVKEFVKVGGISGFESFVRNLAYMVMISRMVNIVNEQGTYWFANNFIWGWLLLPVIQLGELIKQEISTNCSRICKVESFYQWSYRTFVFTFNGERIFNKR